MTIGSGRIIEESLVRINKAIKEGSFANNKALNNAIDNCKTHGSTFHLLGLLQDEGVHALASHLYSILDTLKEKGIFNICIHVITDGRDSPPHAAKEKIAALEAKLDKLGVGKIATISGRYYAMDRDHRWDRTQKAYQCIVDGNADEIIQLDELYKSNETDEFIIPRKQLWYAGFQDNDSVLFFNFRTDRTRQLTQAVVEEVFDGFARDKKKILFLAMMHYYDNMNAAALFADVIVENNLGKVLADNGLKQLRISETEKYAHVTFFFNSQVEEPNEKEARILVNSPKVATYDLKPEMSAYEITEKVLEQIDNDIYDVIVMNIVNCDMIGHTGIVDACLKAVEVVDSCTQKIVEKILEKNGVALVFADHGNIEDQRPEWITSHTCNPVPFIAVANNKFELRETGGLQDIAPTVLHLLGIEKPEEMTGQSLIIN